MEQSRTETPLVFFVNGRKIIDENVHPVTTLADYLRTKRLRQDGKGLHPIQERLSKFHGSQCGFCTPGFVMAMYALLRNNPQPPPHIIQECIQGNLCRCTGYRPILEAFETFSPCCGKQKNGACCMKNISEDKDLQNTEGIEKSCWHDANPYDPTQDPIFPPELQKLMQDDSNSRFSLTADNCTWIRPVSLDELIRLKAQEPSLTLVAGNTILGRDQKFGFVEHRLYVDISNIPALKKANRTSEGLYMGAGITISEAQGILREAIHEEKDSTKTRVFSAALEMMLTLGGKHTRNVATIGGNLAGGGNISNLNPIWFATETLIVVQTEKRGIQRKKMDPSLNSHGLLEADEIISGVIVPFTKTNEHIFVYRHADRRTVCAATVIGAFFVELDSESSRIVKARTVLGNIGSNFIILERSFATSASEKDSLGLEGAKREMVADILTELAHCTQYIQCLCVSLVEKLTHDLEQTVKDESKYAGPVGRPMMHLSAEKQTSGLATYCDDISVADTLYLYPVLSRKSRGKVVCVDASKAKLLPGVIDLIDWRDIPENGSLTMGFHDDQKVFAKDEVQFFGQPIGAIVAENQETARKAAYLVNVQYEDTQPPVLTIEEALEQESYFPNVTPLRFSNKRDPEDPSVIGEIDWSGCGERMSGKQRMGGQEHFYMEPMSAIAVPLEDNELDITLTSQALNASHIDMAHVCGVPMNKITMRIRRLGGGFGGKEKAPSILAAPCALAALKLKRPVRCTVERYEDMIMFGTRHPFLGEYEVGFSSDGVLKAFDIKLHSNAGASVDLSNFVMAIALSNCTSAYYIPSVHAYGTPLCTNTQSATAFRGFGIPQAEFIMESVIERVAEKLHLTPETVREKNIIRKGNKAHYGQVFENDNAMRCWAECKELSDYQNRLSLVQTFNSENKHKKKGIAMVNCIQGLSHGPLGKVLGQAGCVVNVYTDGTVLINHGGIEMGQGLYTKMTQVAATTLGVSGDLIHIQETSTDKVPNASPSVASMGSDLWGMAIKMACEELSKRIRPFKEANPDGKWESWVKSAYLDRVDLSCNGFYRMEYPDFFTLEKGQGNLFKYYVHGAACAEVEIDALTGDHKFLRADIVMDIGNSLNPALDIGQIEGAFVQGYGLFTLEQLKMSSDGQWLCRGPGSYKIPTADDVPLEFNVKLLKDSQNEHAVYSSKAVGEPPLFLGSSAFFAIKEAIKSARKDNGHSTDFDFESPATAEKIRMACEDDITQLCPQTSQQAEREFIKF